MQFELQKFEDNNSNYIRILEQRELQLSLYIAKNRGDFFCTPVIETRWFHMKPGRSMDYAAKSVDSQDLGIGVVPRSRSTLSLGQECEKCSHLAKFAGSSQLHCFNSVNEEVCVGKISMRQPTR